MGESEKGIESPIEVLWQLIEEGGKWTDEIVSFARTQIIVFMLVILQSVLLLSCVSYNISRDPEPIPFPYVIAVVMALILYVLIVGNAIIKLRRKYKNRLARRDRWREKFEMLKKKEEEIEKQLFEEAG